MREIERIEDEIEEIMADSAIPGLQEDAAKLREALDKFLISKEVSIEDDRYKATPVQAVTRTWSVDKLRKLVTPRIFKSIVKYSIDSAAIDELVRAGKLDRKQIASAYEEKPKAPYVKLTAKKEDDSAQAQDEAAKLKAALK